MIQFSSKSRNLAFAGASLAAIVAFTGLNVSGAVPAFAEAVTVTAPQAPGFADVVEKVKPAVVSVRVKGSVQPADFDGDFPTPPGFEDLPRDHPLNRFFRDFRGNREFRGERRDRERPNRPRRMSQGSGFFISEDGYVVTNNHVIESGEAYTVVMDDGTELDARLIGTDQRTDLALLKVNDSRKFTYVDFADDAAVRVGDWVVAVGNPFGLGGTVTAGIVSARGRDIGAGPYDDFIQIDAAVNRGNSGGPAFNLSGKVVGINTAIFSPSGGNVGIAFAIPASTAEEVIADLKQDGSVQRGWLGVAIQPVTKDIAESIGLAEAKGAIVNDIEDDTPAKSAGIEAGDVIVSVDGQKIESPRELSRKIASLAPGAETKVGVFRDGTTRDVTVKLGALPEPEKQANADPSGGADEQSAPAALENFGLTVAPNDNGDGLVVTDVEADSDAAENGIQAGDVIASVNSVAVKSAADIETAIAAAQKDGRKAVLFQIMSNDRSRFVALPIGQG
jgi:serine protease Do